MKFPAPSKLGDVAATAMLASSRCKLIMHPSAPGGRLTLAMPCFNLYSNVIVKVFDCDDSAFVQDS